ncbi:myo-inositol-1-phosphate synthase [Galdieria sulphuraria]|uniref:inositol-3-phosphate synthase n=1 Tax=Galdieria sulphuraria TaxID=130081 RepID=M2Y1C8_GALSU|nr:myo-inositol-1-phosphate synthase [Galdieria sulphuraria]EME29619.1 myo-inositol-1-phosphate synthase [Galdieria sulphuraria]|eukprot:XP_005706139.1 myo-inositol-1-phosphate synthase [Galdieria sulphuraria]
MTDNDAWRALSHHSASTVTKQKNCKVSGPHVSYFENEVRSSLKFQRTLVQTLPDGSVEAIPKELLYEFCTKLKPSKLGIMQVGWGGNNGSTVTAGIVANKEGISWETSKGMEKPNLFGSLSQHGTLRLGISSDGTDVFVPFKSLLPLVEPKDIVLGGWDISSLNLAEALDRAQILEPDLKRKLRPLLESMKPLPGIFDEEFIAENQLPRADNVIETKNKARQVEIIRQDIRKFKQLHNLDFVVVVWTANSERYSVELAGVNDTAESLLKAISSNHKEVSPSTLYAVASILEGCPYVNGSPQNTFVRGCIQLAEENQVFIVGDDFKSGQTKMKSVLVDYLVGSGMKVESMVTYNHLGNNDMFQLTDGEMWKPKSAAKSRVIEDIVSSNGTLYEKDEMPDHVVVVRYVSSYGDSKSDVSEYVTRTFMNCPYRTVMYNNCLDSALCAPLIIDLAIFIELFHRVSYRTSQMKDFAPMHPVLSALSFYMKIPRTPVGEPLVNALQRQRACIENLFRALVGLNGEDNLFLETKFPCKRIDEEYLQGYSV